MKEGTVKLGLKNYNTVKALADKSGLSVREVADNLIHEGLNNANELGKVVSSNDNLVDKLRADVEALRRSNAELKGRVDDIEVEVGEQAAEVVKAAEITREDLLGKPSKASKPGKRETDETVYFCVHCAKNGKRVELDAEEKPESCPGCGRKLNWKGEEGSGIGTVLLGLLALAFLGRTITRAQQQL